MTQRRAYRRMEIIKAENSGFCFGVSNAVKKAYEICEKYKGVSKVYSLGKIIHNDRVVRELENEGIITIDSPEEAEDGSVVLIRAHGVSPSVYRILEGKNCLIEDATCPFVSNIHKIVEEKYKEGCRIIICGDPNHPEVKGINGMCDNTAAVISSLEEIKAIPCDDPGENVCLVAQTTFNESVFKEIAKEIKKIFDNALIFDTICFATSKRQQETENISKSVDLMIVVGGRESSNTRKLYEISKENCPEVILVEDAEELKSHSIINNIRRVGVTAGASTPGAVIEEVIVTMENSVENSTVENAGDVSFESMLEESLTTLKNGDIVKGAITNKDAKGVYIDLGFKYEGFIANEEFIQLPDQQAPEFNVGDVVEAVVVRVSDKDCEVILSKRRIDYKKEIQAIENSYENKTPLEVTVREAVNGGVVARLGSTRIFIPASQLDDRFIRNPESFVGKTINVVITTFEKGPKGKMKIVGSRRVLVEAEKKEAYDRFWSDAYEGKVCKCTVKNFTPFGAFVDLGGIDGLIPISELSWKRISRPQDVLKAGQEIEARIIGLDKEKNRISLSYRKEEEDPWYDAENLYQVGDILEVTVSRFTPFGVFVNVAKDIDGLVHISQISNRRINKAEDCLEVGQKVLAKIIEVDIPAKRLSLSIKEVQPIDPKNLPEEAENAEGEETEKKPRRNKKKQKVEKNDEENFEIKNEASGTSIGDILAAKMQEQNADQDK